MAKRELHRRELLNMQHFDKGVPTRRLLGPESSQPTATSNPILDPLAAIAICPATE